eukprot:CAMPEP_0178490166 /NCGR_PEP_ID=MMETSP0696-20121128/10752_1 /TAXON_ID=265572 /ORGANISM="Extubocellulus spinifer, Strain CCMP396" /LENGTH=646 /DNA_ID=CAMNT_0020117991 /DNA_START=27 /DNA_END=1962 /DNA_ORIENTATION=-
MSSAQHAADAAAQMAAHSTALATYRRSVSAGDGGGNGGNSDGSAAYDREVQTLIGTYRKIHDPPGAAAPGDGDAAEVFAFAGAAGGTMGGAARAAIAAEVRAARAAAPPSAGIARSYGGRSIAQIVAGRNAFGPGRQVLLRGRENRTSNAAPVDADAAGSEQVEDPNNTRNYCQDGNGRSGNGNGNGGGWCRPIPTASIRTEIRRYGEHCSSTKFHWSYLGSTGDAVAAAAAAGGAARAGIGAGAARAGGAAEAEDDATTTATTTVADPLTADTSPSIPAVSTISLSFSPDGKTLASTHGDHTVKITCCHTGKLIRNLDGHPRTPWTVKYHPTDSNIVASGCLGFQVRVWDWNYRPNRVVRRNGIGVGVGMAGQKQHQETAAERKIKAAAAASSSRGDWSPRAVVNHPGNGFGLDPNGQGGDGAAGGGGGAGGADGGGIGGADGGGMGGIGTSNYDILPGHYAPYDPSDYDYHLSRGVCLSMIRLQYAIISLSFHPTGHVLACASGSKVHLWDWDDVATRERREWEEEEKERERREEEAATAAAVAALAATAAGRQQQRPSSAPAAVGGGAATAAATAALAATAGRQQQRPSSAPAAVSGGLMAMPPRSNNQLQPHQQQQRQQYLTPVTGQPPASAGSGRASLPAG